MNELSCIYISCVLIFYSAVVAYEYVYTIIKKCHERVGHHGRDKTWREVVFCTKIQNENYNFILSSGETTVLLGSI